MEIQRPSDWDWVTARRDCSIAKFFERLLAGAQRDVRTRKEMRLELFDQGPLEFNASAPGIFSVFRGLAPGRHVAVRFVLEGDRIVVEGQGVSVNFEGRITLNNHGECRLKVADQDLDEWQVLRMALEPVFFGG